jgi:Zn-dependent membrane protease YugP
MLLIYIFCYGVFALFALVTLPVEFDASKRALAWVKTRSIVTPGEYDMAQDALKWAAMTYVAAAIGAILTLIYFVLSYIGLSRD